VINLSKFLPFFIPYVYRACSFFTNLDLFCTDNARVIYRKIRYMESMYWSMYPHPHYKNVHGAGDLYFRPFVSCATGKNWHQHKCLPSSLLTERYYIPGSYLDLSASQLQQQSYQQNFIPCQFASGTSNKKYPRQVISLWYVNQKIPSTTN